MVTHCICFNISFTDILKQLETKTLEELNICNKCKLCNPYIEELTYKNYGENKKYKLEEENES